MIADGFEVFVTVDRKLQYQQNLDRLPLNIFVLCSVDNRRETLKLLIPLLLERLKKGNLQNVIEVSL